MKVFYFEIATRKEGCTAKTQKSALYESRADAINALKEFENSVIQEFNDGCYECSEEMDDDGNLTWFSCSTGSRFVDAWLEETETIPPSKEYRVVLNLCCAIEVKVRATSSKDAKMLAESQSHTMSVDGELVDGWVTDATLEE